MPTLQSVQLGANSNPAVTVSAGAVLIRPGPIVASGEGSDVKKAIYVLVAFMLLAGVQVAINRNAPDVPDETPADRDAICAIAHPVLQELANDNDMRSKIQCNVRYYGPGKARVDGQGSRPLAKGVRVVFAKSFGSWFVVNSLSCKLAECAATEGLPPDWSLP